MYLETFVYEDNSKSVEREYIYYHPASAPAKIARLLPVFHGYSRAVRWTSWSTPSSTPLRTTLVFAACYPRGEAWIRLATRFSTWATTSRSTKTSTDLASHLSATSRMATSQSQSFARRGAVYATGMSNGGDFCYLLACQASDVFQAVAPVSGMIMQDSMDACNPNATTNHFGNSWDQRRRNLLRRLLTPPTRTVGELIRAFLKPWRFLWTCTN